VAAVNEAGAGEPSESSGSIAAKPEKGTTAIFFDLFIDCNASRYHR
jgi:hypothetical protein